MRTWAAIVLSGILLAGCTTTSSDIVSKDSIDPNNVPSAVQGAFFAEHPYAKMDHPSKLTSDKGVVSYEIPYVRPDGTKGKATYAETGDLQIDQ